SACPEPGNDHTIVCNDDGYSPPDRASLVVLDYSAGQRYLIRVAGYNGAHGPYVLTTTELGYIPMNNWCTSPEVVSAPGSYPFRACACTTEQGVVTSCTDVIKDVWYLFNA